MTSYALRRIRGRTEPERLEAKAKLYRVYAGPGKDYRVIYQIQHEKLLVLVVRVGDRKDVYRRVK